MKKNLRDKFHDFLASEEGRVGIAGGSLLLAQAMLPTAAEAHTECFSDDDCDAGKRCDTWSEPGWSPGCKCHLWMTHSACVN